MDAKDEVEFMLDGIGEHDILANSGRKLIFDSAPTVHDRKRSKTSQTFPNVCSNMYSIARPA